MKGMRALGLALVLSQAPAALACDATTIQIVSGSSVSMARYDPFQSESQQPVQLAIRNTSSMNCEIGVAFSTGASPRLSGVGGQLPFAIEASGGEPVVFAGGFIAGSAPTAQQRVDVSVAPGSTASISLRMRVPAGEIVRAGTYSSPIDFLLGLYSLDAARRPAVRLIERPFAVTATVVPACRLQPPSSRNLDFSSAVAHGRPDASVVKRTTFNDIACTAPASVRLSGDALQQARQLSTAGDFDTVLHWRAQTTLGNASVVFDTLGGNSATSPARTGTGALVNGSMTVDVNLSGRRPVVAGDYAGQLTVWLIPEF